MSPLESALLIRCPEAEHAVAPLRVRYDRAAQVGVPAHVTVIYPFKAVGQLTESDHARLANLIRSLPLFEITFATTSWFGDSVVFVSPLDPEPIVAVTDAVIEAFPDFPPYGGAFDTVVPHLTVGHGQPLRTLRTAEREVQAHLPFVQAVSAVELWGGPALASGVGAWTMRQRYDLG